MGKRITDLNTVRTRDDLRRLAVADPELFAESAFDLVTRYREIHEAMIDVEEALHDANMMIKLLRSGTVEDEK